MAHFEAHFGTLQAPLGLERGPVAGRGENLTQSLPFSESSCLIMVHPLTKFVTLWRKKRLEKDTNGIKSGQKVPEYLNLPSSSAKSSFMLRFITQMATCRPDKGSAFRNLEKNH